MTESVDWDLKRLLNQEIKRKSYKFFMILFTEVI